MSAVDTFRNALFGNPPSPTTKPSREGALAAFAELYEASVIAQAAAQAGITIVSTIADRDAFYATEANRGKLVYVNNNNGSATDPANGVYEYVGGSARIAQAFYQGVLTTVQPLIDQAALATTQAQKARLLLGAARLTLGDMIDRVTLDSAPQNGAVATPRGFTISNGNGRSSFFACDSQIDEVTRPMIPNGTKCRMIATITMSAGGAAIFGAPSPTYPTRVKYVTDPVGGSHLIGAYDAVLSGYVGDTLIVQTTFDWDPQILSAGVQVQFGNIPSSYSGTYTAELTGLALVIDALPGGVSMTASDLVDQVNRARDKAGAVLSYTVGQGKTFANLALAQAAFGNAKEANRRQLMLTPGTDLTKIQLPDFTDIVGYGPRRSEMAYTGSTAMVESTRRNYDPLRLYANSRVANIAVRCKNCNYGAHMENDGAVRDYVRGLEDFVIEHAGNDEVYAVSGDAAIMWIPAIGIGGSSGGFDYLKRGTAVSKAGGGVLVHNSKLQTKPHRFLIEDLVMGGDHPVAADLTITTLGSQTPDTGLVRTSRFTNGFIRFVTSAAVEDPLNDGAWQHDYDLIVDGSSPFITRMEMSGRALRFRGKTAQATGIAGQGAAYEALMGAYPNVAKASFGGPGRYPSLIGWLNLSAAGRMGQLLGDCSSSPKLFRLIFGNQTLDYTFNQDMRGVSNGDILTRLTNAFGSVVNIDLFDVSATYRPKVASQEVSPINTSSYDIVQGAAVVLTSGGTVCRPAEPSDFTGSGGYVDPAIKIGIALEDVPVNRAGRIQWRGWTTPEQTLANVAANLNEGYGIADPSTVGGVHGALTYKGSGGAALRCIRASAGDGLGRSIPATLLIS